MTVGERVSMKSSVSVTSMRSNRMLLPDTDTVASLLLSAVAVTVPVGMETFNSSAPA